MKKRIFSLLFLVFMVTTMSVSAEILNKAEDFYENIEEADFAEGIMYALALPLDNAFFEKVDKNEPSAAADLKKAMDEALIIAQNKETATAEEKNKALKKLYNAIITAARAANGTPKDRFSDVLPDAWYSQAVDYTLKKGIFKGTSDTTFSPDMPITRAMFLTVVGRLYMEEDIEYQNTFSDVSEDAYYKKAVSWAKTYNMLPFVEGNNFSPDKPITREELVTVFYHARKYAGYEAEEGEVSFQDSENISKWANAPIAWAVKNNVVQGFEDKTFRPDGSATRAQTAQIMMNLGV